MKQLSSVITILFFILSLMLLLKQWTDFFAQSTPPCARCGYIPIKIDCHEKIEDNWRQPMKWWESKKKLLVEAASKLKLKIVISWERFRHSIVCDVDVIFETHKCSFRIFVFRHSFLSFGQSQRDECVKTQTTEAKKREPKNHQEMINLKSLNSIRSLVAHRKKTRTFRHRWFWFPHTLWIEHNTTHSRAIDMFIINKQSDGIIRCDGKEEVNEFLMARKFIVDTQKLLSLNWITTDVLSAAAVCEISASSHLKLKINFESIH